MQRLGVVLAAVLSLTFLFQGSAAAQRDIEWCAEDPMFHVLGTHFSLTTRIHAAAADVASISYTVELPSNAGDVKINYPGGRRIPTTVVIERTGAAYTGGSFGVSVTETVTGPSGRDVVVDITGRASGTATDTTNHPFSYSFTVSAK